jgi:DNA gyrase subunit A
MRRGTNTAVLMNNLYKHTAMERKYGIIMLALFDNKPEVKGLRGFLKAFVDHRIEVVTRRTLFDLKRAEERLHILEGLRIAVENIDAIIELIKKSKDPKEAKERLMKKYHLSAIQAQAILDIRLHRLTSLERVKIMEEHKQTLALIEELKEILVDENKKMKIVTGELQEIKEKYGDPRRTEIISKTEELSIEDLIEEEEMVITVTKNGYVKRTPLSVFRQQNRGGKGVKGMATRDGDYVNDVFVTSTHHFILILTKKGKLYWLKVYDIPELGAVSKGQAIVNLVHMDPDDAFATATAVKEFPEDNYLMMATRAGYIKKTSLSEFATPRSNGIIAVTVDDDDELIGLGVSHGSNDILIASRQGKCIRFNEDDVRPMGRSARGVKAITLRKEDYVVGMSILSGEEKGIMTITDKGFGKQTVLDEYSPQSRGGSGLININVTAKNGPVMEILLVKEEDEVLFVSASGKAIRLRASNVPKYGRNTQGVRIMELDKDDHIVGVAKITENI